MVNAWELLLKSIIVNSEGEKSISEKGKSTIGVSRLVRRIYPDLSDPLRENLETVIEMRNEATHFLLRETSAANVRIFQTNVVNYLATVKDNGLGEEIQDISSGVILATQEFDQIDYDLIGRRYSPRTAQKVKELQDSIARQAEVALPTDSNQTTGDGQRPPTLPFRGLMGAY